MKVVSKMPHIQSSGLNFDPRMAHSYMDCLKRAVREGIWRGLCPDWFDAVNDKEEITLFVNGDVLVEIRPEELVQLQSVFVLQFSSGKRVAESN